MVERSPRIAMVIQKFPPILGGAELQAAQLAAELARRDRRVFVVTARFRGMPTSGQWEGVPVHRLWCPTDSERPSRFGLYAFLGSLAWFLVAHARAYDIVHAHQVTITSAVAVAVGNLLGKKTLFKAGGAGPNGDVAHLAHLRSHRAMSAMVRQADAAVVSGRAIGEDLARAGLRAEQVHSIPNGVATGALAPARSKEGARRTLGIRPEVPIVLYVGSLRQVKGVDILLEAWVRVAAQCPSARLLIVGAGPSGPALQRRSTELGLSGSVTFAGMAADPRDFYWAADVFVLPSRSEGFPNVILEALAAGLPCVASKVGGIPEQIEPGRNGWLVPPEDPPALADALIQLLSDPARVRTMGAYAAESVRRFDWDRVAPAYLALYEALVGPARAHGKEG